MNRLTVQGREQSSSARSRKRETGNNRKNGRDGLEKLLLLGVGREQQII